MVASPLWVAGQPGRLSGTVYGALLNHRPQWAAIGDAAHHAPYGSPPRAPVLAVKPRHTLARHGDTVYVPSPYGALEVGASLGLVIGRVAHRVWLDQARDFIAGYVTAMELNVAYPSHYRSAARFTTRDGFCPLSRDVVEAHRLADPDALDVQLWVDGVLVQRTDTTDRVRNVSTLLCDVTAFMTLQPGDVLLLGASAPRVQVRALQTIEARIQHLPPLQILLADGERGHAGNAHNATKGAP